MNIPFDVRKVFDDEFEVSTRFVSFRFRLPSPTDGRASDVFSLNGVSLRDFAFVRLFLFSVRSPNKVGFLKSLSCLQTVKLHNTHRKKIALVVIFTPC